MRLDEPERKEIESRAGATTPLRNSKDILRAFEKLAGGPDAITVDIDPGLADPMRDVGRGLGYGLSNLPKSFWRTVSPQITCTPASLNPCISRKKSGTP